MTTTQLFFAMATLFLAIAVLMKYYIDAKIDPLASDVKMLVQYMIEHEGKIAVLQEKTKHL
jgi:hypothetical protein